VVVVVGEGSVWRGARQVRGCVGFGGMMGSGVVDVEQELCCVLGRRGEGMYVNSTCWGCDAANWGTTPSLCCNGIQPVVGC